MARRGHSQQRSGGGDSGDFCTVQLEKKTKMLFDLVGKNVPAKLIHHSSRCLTHQHHQWHLLFATSGTTWSSLASLVICFPAMKLEAVCFPRSFPAQWMRPFAAEVGRKAVSLPSAARSKLLPMPPFRARIGTKAGGRPAIGCRDSDAVR